MNRHFSILVTLGTDARAGIPYTERDGAAMKKHCKKWHAELERDLWATGYGKEGEYRDVPDNHNGHYVRAFVSYPQNQVSQGGRISIQEWHGTFEVKEGEELPEGNVTLTRKDAPALWRIVDNWKKRIEGRQ